MIVPVAAVADTVATSAALVSISASTDDVPARVFVPVNVCAVDRLATSDKVLLPNAMVLLVRVWVPVNVAIPAAANVDAPVPPLAIASVPARVTVPEEVIGPPLVVNPVVPPETSTLVTEPAPGPVNATVMAPLPLVIVTPEPAVSVAGVSVLPVVLPISS